MTHDEIEKLDEDGLRLEVARVLGWVEKFGRMDKASSRIHQYFVKPDGRISLYPPDWPRDIAAAWVLVEEMQGAGMVMLKVWKDNRHQAWCTLVTPDNRHFDGAHPTSITVSICRCWLCWKYIVAANL